MSSPTTTDKNVSLVNPPTKQVKMVKIKTSQAIRLNRDNSETIVPPGKVIDVTEDEAKEFCDRQFKLGMRDTFGNFDKNTVRPTIIRRAERVTG